MSPPTTLAVSESLPRFATRFGEALMRTVRRITWRTVALTLAITVALDAWLIFDVALADPSPKLPAGEGYLSGAIVNLLMAFSIMFTTLVADEMVARGAKRLPAYACAVIAGSALAALVQWQVHQWLHLRTRFDLPGAFPHEANIMYPAAMFFEFLIWGAVIVSIYVNRRTALLATARVNAAQVELASAKQRTLQSRLQALQARVEPQFLFDTLAQVRDLYKKNASKGAQMLDDLIVYLRAALPQLRESTSTLEQELKLVGAYLSIMRMHLGGRLAFDIDAPQAALVTPMPPMILLPMIERVLSHELTRPALGCAILIAARSDADHLRVEISDGAGRLGNGSDDILHAIRDRLHALYGERATLVFEFCEHSGARMVMEIPHEAANGGHR